VRFPRAHQRPPLRLASKLNELPSRMPGQYRFAAYRTARHTRSVDMVNQSLRLHAAA
jgi:hypothetical protein